MRDVVGWVKKQGEFEIRRDEEARKLWAKVYPDLSDGRPGLLGAATGRGEAHVLRLSANYALLDCNRVVKAEHLTAALACWDYAFDSAKFIFADAIGDPVADRILEALRTAGEDGLTRTQIRDLFARNQTEGRITQALNQLAALGLASCEMIRTEGRPVERWHVNGTT